MKTVNITDKITLIHGDCMDYLAGCEAGAFDLSLVDPPYGIGAGSKTYGKRKEKHKKKDWDENIPPDYYFSELMRASEKQIIWGGNYFPLPLTGGWLFWDKERGKDTTFSDGELAWTSFLNTLKKCSIRYDGFIGADTARIHPTQKPVKLYEWIYANYAEKGQRIIDTHLGSGSNAIAAHYAGMEFVGIELDEDYFNASVERIRNEIKQETLF